MPLYYKRLQALQTSMNIWENAKGQARIGCCFENPVSVLWNVIGKPQYVQPWQFGHGETKKTGLRLHNLPELKPTKIVDGREQRVWKMAPSPTRKRDRSETFQGVADAFADQWGSL
jgi:hypothetical protein